MVYSSVVLVGQIDYQNAEPVELDQECFRFTKWDCVSDAGKEDRLNDDRFFLITEQKVEMKEVNKRRVCLVGNAVFAEISSETTAAIELCGHSFLVLGYTTVLVD